MVVVGASNLHQLCREHDRVRRGLLPCRFPRSVRWKVQRCSVCFPADCGDRWNFWIPALDSLQTYNSKRLAHRSRRGTPKRRALIRTSLFKLHASQFPQRCITSLPLNCLPIAHSKYVAFIGHFLYNLSAFDFRAPSQ